MVGQLTGLECNKGCMQSSQKTKTQNGLVKSVDQDQRTGNPYCQSVTHRWIRVRKCVKCSKSSRKPLIYTL